MLQSGPVLAVGTMSGTSLDGVDVAAVVTDGVTITAFGRTAYRPYSAEEQAALHAVRGCWPTDAGVADAARIVEAAHAQVLADFTDADVIGFHGQTLAHDPANGRTHQAGSGDALARTLGKTVVWDFRTADVERGGEGAPLAPFFHFACAKWAGLDRPVAFLNLGGVGNITWVDPRFDAPDADALLAFDTGPANAPLNDLLLARRGVARDEGGALAASGRVDDAIVQAFLQSPYFHRKPPKSLDRDAFTVETAGLSDADAAATLTACCAASVAAALPHMPVVPAAIYVCGGGRKNATMMAAIAARCAVPVQPVEDIGLDGDMLEAQAFAWLAVRVMRGLPTSGPTTTGVSEPVCGGKISTP